MENLTFFLRKINEFRLTILLWLSPFLISFYAASFYPGYLTSDSLYMLSQGIGDVPLSNWHPPFLTLAWGWMYGLYKSAGAIWLLQVSLFVASALLFASRIRNALISFFIYFALLLYPPVFTNMAALWKDCWVLSTTLICLTFAIDAINKKGHKYIFFAALFFIVSVLIRVDYAIICLPFILAAIVVGLSDQSISRREYIYKVAFSISILFFCLFLAGRIVGSQVVDRLNPWLNTAIWDIVGIEQHSSPTIFIPGYNCSTSDPLVFGSERKFNINLPQQPKVSDPASEAGEYFSHWKNSILENPFAYLKHRFCVANSFLNYGTEQVHYPYPRAEMSGSPLTQRSERSSLNIDLYWFFDRNSFGPMYRYWYYLFVSIVALMLGAVFRKPTLPEVVVMSSIFLSAARFMVLPATDFRYGLWMVVGTMVLVALIIDQRISQFRVKRSP